MIIVDIEQGSPEWLAIRLGLISASRFKDVMTEPKLKVDREAGNLSKTALSYMSELIAEIVTGSGIDLDTKALRWGNENEARALSEYSFSRGVNIDSTGIIISDCGLYGASPDCLTALSADGMQEVKCPFNSKNHINNLVYGMDKDHMPQIQGNLWINGREWCDFISFDPRISGEGRLYVERIFRDEEYISRLERKLNKFAEELKKILKSKFGIDWDGVNVQEYI